MITGISFYTMAASRMTSPHHLDITSYPFPLNFLEQELKENIELARTSLVSSRRIRQAERSQRLRSTYPK